MNQPWIYMYSPARSPHPPPSPPDPSGSSQCTRSEHLSHASSLGWWYVSPYIIYMFRCCVETSHPCLLPQSPKVCSVHLCLFFCFAYRVIVTIFLKKETLYPSAGSSHSSLPPTQTTLIYFLSVLDTSYKWNHTVCSLSCLSLSLSVLKVYPCYHMHQYFIPLYN